MYKKKKSLLVDLGVIFIFLPLCLPLFILFGNYINENSNFISVVLLSIIEFCGAGLGAFIIIAIRNESMDEYGINRINLKNSIVIGVLFCLVMMVIKSVDAGELLYFPMRNHTAMVYSMNLAFPLNIIGIVMTLLIWGSVEAIYYVVIIKKIEDFFKKDSKVKYLLVPIIFYSYNFCIHFVIRVIVEQRTCEFGITNMILELMLAYAMFIPRKVTGNSSGSLIYQTFQNGLGRI